MAVAGVVLFVRKLPQHSIEDNALGGVPSSATSWTSVPRCSPPSKPWAGLWLALVLRGLELLEGVGLAPVPTIPLIAPDLGASVGLLVLAVALFVEHEMGVQFALRTGDPGSGV